MNSAGTNQQYSVHGQGEKRDDPPLMPASAPHRHKLEIGAIAGFVLVLLALVIPSAEWIELIRTSTGNLREKLLAGASLFRLSLAALGLFVIAGSTLRWWKKNSAEPLIQKKNIFGFQDPVLLLILIAAAIIRFYRLDQGLWQDEILTLVDYARAPFGDIVTTFQSQNQHFLYSLLTHASFLFLGESAWALRLPAVVFGILSIWMLYVFAREVSSRMEALLSAALLCVSYQHVWFSQNARGYTGLLFWALLSSWLLIRALSQQQPRLWLFYALSITLGIYTNTAMIFVVAAHVLIYGIELFSRSKPSFLDWTPLFSGFGLAAFLTFALHAFTIPQIIGEPLADLSPVPAWRNPLWGLQELIHGLGGWAVVIVGSTIAAVGSLDYIRKSHIVFLLLFVPIALTASVTIALGHPLWPRLFFAGLGFGVLIFVRGIVVMTNSIARLFRWSPETAKKLAIACILAGAMISLTTLRYVYRPKQDYAGARDFINASRNKSDFVVAVGLASYPYKNYYAPDWKVAQNAKELDAMMGQKRHTWVVYSFPMYMESTHPDILLKLKKDFRLVKVFDGSVQGGKIYVYQSGEL